MVHQQRQLCDDATEMARLRSECATIVAIHDSEKLRWEEVTACKMQIREKEIADLRSVGKCPLEFDARTTLLHSYHTAQSEPRHATTHIHTSPQGHTPQLHHMMTSRPPPMAPRFIIKLTESIEFNENGRPVAE